MCVDTANTTIPQPFDIRAYYRELTRQLLARDTLSQSLLTHGTLLGNLTENIVRDFIRKILPPHIGVETGQIAAPNGTMSPQSDVVIFSNVFGAVLGVLENGSCLIHQDAVKCVIEVKRSSAVDQIVGINEYFQRLLSAFQSGTKEDPWFPYSVVFHSPSKSLDAIETELNAIPIGELRVRGVLVLNAKHEAEALKRECNAIPGHSPTGRITGESVEAFLDQMSSPNSAFFLYCDQKRHFIRQWDNEPPLLSFAIRLHESLKSFSGRPYHNWGAFLLDRRT